jgi:hypothetical protein
MLGTALRLFSGKVVLQDPILERLFRPSASKADFGGLWLFMMTEYKSCLIFR